MKRLHSGFGFTGLPLQPLIYWSSNITILFLFKMFEHIGLADQVLIWSYCLWSASRQQSFCTWNSVIGEVSIVEEGRILFCVCTQFEVHSNLLYLYSLLRRRPANASTAYELSPFRIPEVTLRISDRLRYSLGPPAGALHVTLTHTNFCSSLYLQESRSISTNHIIQDVPKVHEMTWCISLSYVENNYSLFQFRSGSA
jgi:hypothetical protein